ncbi:MAG: hypothetical protein E6899_02050 [Neisseria sp.]|nr:hypothetical protein [Neisseria sp.]
MLFPICCNLPPLSSSGRGLGRGWIYGLHEFDFSPNHKATPILTFPRQTGEGTGLLIRQRGRLKIRILDFRRPHSISFNNSNHLTSTTIPFYTFPHLLQPAPSPVRRERAGERVAL